MKKNAFLLVVFSLLFYGVRPGFVQGFKPDARSISLGGSAVVQARDPSAMFWNPSLLAGLKDRAILLSVNEPFEFNLASFTQFVPLLGTFGVSLMRVPLPEDELDRGVFAWGKELNHWLSFGTNLNFQRESSKWFAATSWGLVIGNPVIGTLNQPWGSYPKAGFLDKFSFGFTVHDIPLSEQVVETSVLTGMSYLFPSTRILLNSGYHIQEGNNTKHVGLGYGLTDRFVVYSGLEEFDFDNLAFGAGLTHDNFSVNFSYSRQTEKLQITISARLSPHPEEIAQPYFERGMDAFENGNRRTALHNLKRYLAFGPASSGVDTARALVDMVEQRQARVQSTVDSLFRVANNYLTPRDPQFLRAALNLTRVLEFDPENQAAREKLEVLSPYVDDFIQKSIEEGRMQLENKNYEEARKLFRRILFFEKNHNVALQNLATIEQAMAELGEEHFYRGVGFYRQKNYHLAKDEFNTALNYNPNLREAASYLRRTNAKIDEAENKIEKLLNSGQALELRADYFEATNTYLRVLELDPDNRKARNRIANLRPRVDELVEQKFRNAQSYFQDEKYILAEEALREVLSIDPQLRDARKELTRLRLEKRSKIQDYLKQAETAASEKDWQRAEELYAKVLSLDQTNARAREGQAEVQRQIRVSGHISQAEELFSQGDYPGAIEEYEKALRVDPDHSEALKKQQKTQQALDEQVERLFNQGINLFTLDQYEEAIAKWNEVLKLAPNHKGALEYRKQAHERLTALKNLEQ